MRSLRAIGRIVAVLAVAAALGGCNLVVSPAPMFTAGDAHGLPALRSGVWASPDAGCSFKSADPFDKWPHCANGAIVGPDSISGPATTPSDAASSAPPASEQTVVPYILAGRDPRVMQVRFGAALTKGAPPVVLYYFVALRPVASDASGQITAAQIWPVQCGPPPPKNAKVDANTNPNDLATRHPLPGMKLDNGLCAPADKAAVVNAAKASRAWADQIATLRWIRDGTK